MIPILQKSVTITMLLSLFILPLAGAQTPPPLPGSSTDAITIDLEEGWNFVPGFQDDRVTERSVTAVYGIENNEYVEERQSNLDSTKGYWVFTTQDIEVDVEITSNALRLQKGWNGIGLLDQGPDDGTDLHDYLEYCSFERAYTFDAEQQRYDEVTLETQMEDIVDSGRAIILETSTKCKANSDNKNPDEDLQEPIVVEPIARPVTISTDDDRVVGEDVTFHTEENIQSDIDIDDLEIVRKEWIFNGQTEKVSQDVDADVTVSAREPGYYNLKVILTDDEGNTYSTRRAVKFDPVDGDGELNDFSLTMSPRNPGVGEEVFFGIQATMPADENIDFQRYRWRVNDQVVSTQDSFSYRFEEGLNKVQLTATDSDGNQYSDIAYFPAG